VYDVNLSPFLMCHPHRHSLVSQPTLNGSELGTLDREKRNQRVVYIIAARIMVEKVQVWESQVSVFFDLVLVSFVFVFDILGALVKGNAAQVVRCTIGKNASLPPSLGINGSTDDNLSVSFSLQT
jgi:hypothetical protein